MSKSRKAEKRQKRKEKKKLLLQEKLNNDRVKFDIIKLLKEWNIDTKPNLAKFLKEHIQMVRCFNNGNIQFYPTFKYTLSKVFVKFLDGHELIYDMMTDGKFAPKFYFYDGLDELSISGSEQLVVQHFFEQLQKFKFVY